MQEIKYQGKMLEIIEESKPVPGTDKTKHFEFARRAPGVRAIITDGNKIAFSKEYRYEIKDYDYRLPGGKVFDSLQEFKKHSGEEMLGFCEAAVIKECKEEIGFEIKRPKLFHVSNGGGSIVWDLYYFEINDFKIGTQKLEDGELVTGIEWKTPDEIKHLIRENKISEDRTLGVLFRYLIARTKA
jgi:8-oxo-dGTP pyrophosphatase MutT (NUDIX family)